MSGVEAAPRVATRPPGRQPQVGARARSILDRRVFWRLLGLLLGAAVWQVFAQTRQDILIPTFFQTVGGFFELVPRPELWRAFLTSNAAMLVGFVSAVIVGIPLGLLMGRYRVLERLANVYVNLLLVSPLALFIPLIIMSIGLGFTARVVLVFLFAIDVIIVNCRAAVRAIPPAQIEMARSFGASELDVWRYVLTRTGLPGIMTGFRLGLGKAVEGMVLVELLMVAVGIGQLVLRYRGLFEVELLWALVVCVVLEGVVLAFTTRTLERRATPWVWDRQGS